MAIKKSEAEIETWTFIQDPKFENVDIASEADHRKLVHYFADSELLKNWDFAIQHILE